MVIKAPSTKLAGTALIVSEDSIATQQIKEALRELGKRSEFPSGEDVFIC